jgi:hypothetical protein
MTEASARAAASGCEQAFTAEYATGNFRPVAAIRRADSAGESRCSTLNLDSPAGAARSDLLRRKV